MTGSAQAARNDLAFMKSVVEDRGPLPWFFGAHLFAVGVIFGLNLVVGATVARPSAIWSWLPASLLYVPVWFIINARSDYAAMGPSARVFAAVWMAVFLMTLAIVASLIVAQRGSGVNYALIWPSIACALYGGAWMVGGLIRRRGWMALVSLGCFAIAVTCAALVGQPGMLLALGVGLLALFAAPGLVLMRLARRPR